MLNLTKASASLQSVVGRFPRRRGIRERGIPKFCHCGEKAVIKTSGTSKNPGRLFYCCPNGSDGDHLLTWTNERVVEEIEDIKVTVNDLVAKVSFATSNIAPLEKQLQQTNHIVEQSRTSSGVCAIL